MRLCQRHSLLASASGAGVAGTEAPFGALDLGLRLSPDGRFFAACGDGGLIIWKVRANSAEGRPDPRILLQQLARPSDRLVSSLNFSPDGNLLACFTWDDNALHLWDVNNSRWHPQPPLKVNSWFRNAAFYRDSKHLAFIGQGGVPEVWNVVTRQKVYPSRSEDFRGASARSLICIVALSADDAWMAVNNARIDDCLGYAEEGTLTGPAGGTHP